MAVTKKDFVAIAACLSKVGSDPATDLATLATVTGALGNVFSELNPRFDLTRFIQESTQFKL